MSMINENENQVLSSTPDFKQEVTADLLFLIPEAFADGKLDIEKLKELLGEDAIEERERFGLFWPGKRRALRAAQEATSATLRPDQENSLNWDQTRNVFIEGDNLEVLKILQKHYHGKVKVIYIDPPYNTGKDFVYPDNFKEGLDTYLEWSKQVNEVGLKLSSNTESEGRFHSNWLNMMYPRLKLSRNLLAEDGLIFVSIDDHESAHLRKLLDEIYGENNFVASICHKSRGSVSNDKIISPNHNNLLVYARKYDVLFADRKSIGLDPDLSGFDESDDRGPFKLVPVDGPGGARKGNPYYEFLGVEGFYRYSKETMQKLFEDGEIVKRGNTLQRKYYLDKAVTSRKTDTTWWDEGLLISSATTALKTLLEGAYFDSPKPVGLIERILKQFTDKDSLVLDFFAGSGTTAHAVMKLNSEDGGKRKYILVQLPEPTPEESEARKAGFQTISEISRFRIKRAADSIVATNGDQIILGNESLDVGYRAYSLTDTNFTKWVTTSEIATTNLEQHILDLRESASDLASIDQLLAEVLLKQGYSLSEQIRSINIDGLEYRALGDDLLIAYLNERVKPNLEQLRKLLELAPARFLILEDAFDGDDELKTNLVQECKSRDIELWTV